MFSVALLSLLLPVANPVAAAAPALANAARATAADPSIQLSLDRRDYEPGDRARVTVRVRDDGYLLVLRLSPDGYVRVLFPLDPGEDNFVRGDGSYEIRGRGDRNAFTVSSSSGTGTVYAAWSTEPFRFNDYALGDHWDYRVLDGSLAEGDPEAGLTELVQRMSTGHFDYDLVNYSVSREVAYSGTTHYVTAYPAPVGCFDFAWCDGGYGSYLNVSIGFGWGWRHSYWRRPYFYDPFYYPPYYRYGGYYPGYYGCYGCRYRYPTVIVVNPPAYRGRYGYQWKPGSRGGGGAPGVAYRPRGAYASANGEVSSPLFVASKYRRVADDASNRAVGRRRSGTVFGAPVRSGLSDGTGTARRERDLPEVIRGGVRGPAVPRRVEQPSGVTDLRRPAGTRASARSNDGVGVGGSSAHGATRVDGPRRAEPQGAEPRSAMPTRSGAATRSEPRQAEPRRVEPRSVEPRSAAPQRVQPRSVEPRSAAPERVEPRASRVEPRAEVRRVEPRSQPQRVERSVSVQRSQPRAEPRASQPRSAPRMSQPRSAPAPRAQSGRGRRP